MDTLLTTIWAFGWFRPHENRHYIGPRRPSGVSCLHDFRGHPTVGDESMNDNPSAAATRTAKSSLVELLRLVGVPEAAADSVEITGSDPVFATRFRPVVPGAV